MQEGNRPSIGESWEDRIPRVIAEAESFPDSAFALADGVEPAAKEANAQTFARNLQIFHKVTKELLGDIDDLLYQLFNPQGDVGAVAVKLFDSAQQAMRIYGEAIGRYRLLKPWFDLQRKSPATWLGKSNSNHHGLAIVRASGPCLFDWCAAVKRYLPGDAPPGRRLLATIDYYCRRLGNAGLNRESFAKAFDELSANLDIEYANALKDWYATRAKAGVQTAPSSALSVKPDPTGQKQAVTMNLSPFETEILRIVHGLQVKGRRKLPPREVPFQLADSSLSETERRKREAQIADVRLCAKPFRHNPVPKELIYAELWTPDGENAPWKKPGDDKRAWDVVAEGEAGEALARLTAKGLLKERPCAQLTRVAYLSTHGRRIDIDHFRFAGRDCWEIRAQPGAEISNTFWVASLPIPPHLFVKPPEPRGPYELSHPISYGESAKLDFDLTGYSLTPAGIRLVEPEPSSRADESVLRPRATPNEEGEIMPIDKGVTRLPLCDSPMFSAYERQVRI